MDAWKDRNVVLVGISVTIRHLRNHRMRLSGKRGKKVKIQERKSRDQEKVRFYGLSKGEIL